ncbi:hypothetical protein KA005_22035, partial [bacterium]|nr:hypothetical protein [bacterium]
GRAAGQAIDYMTATGETPARDERTRDLLMRALAPKTMYRISQALQGEVLKSMGTGYPIENVGTAGQLLYGAGVNPLALEKSYGISQEIARDDERRKKEISIRGRAYADAVNFGDTRVASEIMHKAAVEGLPIDSIVRSSTTYLSNLRSEDQLQRRYSPESLQEYMRIIPK